MFHLGCRTHYGEVDVHSRHSSCILSTLKPCLTDTRSSGIPVHPEGYLKNNFPEENTVPLVSERALMGVP